MDDTDELVEHARSVTDHLVDAAGMLLRSGADVARVHRAYVRAGLDLLTDAEALALLSSPGDLGARRALAEIVPSIERLLAEARAELRRHADRE